MKQKSLSVSGGCHYHGKKLSWDHYQSLLLRSCKLTRCTCHLCALVAPNWTMSKTMWRYSCLNEHWSLEVSQVCCCQGTPGWEQGAWMHIGHLGTCSFPLHVTIFWMVTDLMMRTEISHLKNSIGERGAWRITREILIHSWISLQRIWLKLTSLSTAFPSDLRLRLKRWHQCFAWRP